LECEIVASYQIWCHYLFDRFCDVTL